MMKFARKSSFLSKFKIETGSKGTLFENCEIVKPTKKKKIVNQYPKTYQIFRIYVN